MSNILDHAIELYVNKRVSEAPRRDFNAAVDAESNTLFSLCDSAGLSRYSGDIVSKVLLPFLEKVEKRLAVKNEQV